MRFCNTAVFTNVKYICNNFAKFYAAFAKTPRLKHREKHINRKLQTKEKNDAKQTAKKNKKNHNKNAPERLGSDAQISFCYS